jgi:polysaccharide biosynthesis/export protein
MSKPKRKIPFFFSKSKCKTASYRLVATIALIAVTCFGQNSTFLLGPGDQITIHALFAPELSDKPVRIDEDGFIRLPLLGRVSAGGLRVEELATSLRARLGDYFKDPQVSLDVLEVKSRPVSVLGAVKSPGVYQIQGPKRLTEMLSMAGGPDQDSGYIVRVSRPIKMGPLPATGQAPTTSGDFTVAEVNLPDLMDGKNLNSNIFIEPQDVITVPRGKLVYVMGEVHRPGGFLLHEQESMGVLQAISMAEGLTATATSGDLKILRPVPGGEKLELTVSVKKILDGKSPETVLLPNDVLFIPRSAAKTVSIRAVEAAIQAGTGVAIWR